MQTTRMARLEHQFQQEIALIIQQELKDPRLGFVTITRVELSKDLSHAKVRFSCLGSAEDQARSQSVLAHSSGFIRGLLMKRFRLRVIPEITFRYDESIAEAIAMEDAFQRLKRPQEEEGAGG